MFRRSTIFALSTSNEVTFWKPRAVWSTCSVCRRPRLTFSNIWTSFVRELQRAGLNFLSLSPEKPVFSNCWSLTEAHQIKVNRFLMLNLSIWRIFGKWLFALGEFLLAELNICKIKFSLTTVSLAKVNYRTDFLLFLLAKQCRKRSKGATKHIQRILSLLLVMLKDSTPSCLQMLNKQCVLL